MKRLSPRGDPPMPNFPFELFKVFISTNMHQAYTLAVIFLVQAA